LSVGFLQSVTSSHCRHSMTGQLKYCRNLQNFVATIHHPKVALLQLKTQYCYIVAQHSNIKLQYCYIRPQHCYIAVQYWYT
jgi:hypothetical protein